MSQLSAPLQRMILQHKLDERYSFERPVVVEGVAFQLYYFDYDRLTAIRVRPDYTLEMLGWSWRYDRPYYPDELLEWDDL